MRAPRRFAVAGALLLSPAACGGGRDVVTESRDVRGVVAPPTGTADPRNLGYEYVARRPLGTVGLAEARGLPRALAEGATDAVADTMQRCLADRLREDRMVQGAARVVARIEDDGNVSGVNVTVSPGADVAANAILCFIAPIKSLTFPPAAAGARGAASARRGLAFEAAWTPPG